METLQTCSMCQTSLMVCDIEAQQYIKLTEYYVVKDLGANETWETCNPYKEFSSICEKCFQPRLNECRKRIVHSNL